MAQWQRLKHVSPWRKLSLALWRAPIDPSVYGRFEINAAALLDHIHHYNQTHNVSLTVTTVVAKALGLAIAKHPLLNCAIKWGRLYQRQTVDIFLQVAVKDHSAAKSHHLSGVRVANIDKKTIKEIHEEIKIKSLKIKDKNDEKFGKTFAIIKHCPQFLLRFLLKLQSFLSFNLGLESKALGLQADPFGSAMVTSVGSLGVPVGFAPLVPFSRTPFLLAVGAIEKKAWVEDEKIVIKPVLELAVTFDHRMIDGLHASEIYKTFCEFLTHPALLE